MPASATASAMAAADSLAASYLTCSRCPMTSAREVFEPRQVLEAPLDQRHFFAAVHALDLEGRLGVQLADGAGGGHGVSLESGGDAWLGRMTGLQPVERSPGGRATRRLLSSTCSSPCSNRRDDVMIVEGVEDHAAVAARPHQPHAAQQAQLVRDGRLAEAEQPGEVADAELGAGERVEDAHARRIAEDLERLGQGADRRLGEQRRLERGHLRRSEVEHVAGVDSRSSTPPLNI